MDRRAFISSLAALPAAALASAPAVQSPAQPVMPPRLTPLRGYSGQDVACDALAIEGRIPDSLRGTLYRNGPGLFERGAERYRHPFDGDGMVQAFRFTDHGVSHRARFVRTAKFAAESKAGRFLVPAFGTAIAPRMPVAGQMPFSAHPKVEPDGAAWNFGAFGERVMLYQIGRDGALVRAQAIALPGAHLVHDFAITQRHLVFLLPPVELDFAAFRAGKALAESLRWHADRATRILTVDKADSSVSHVYELPAFNFFHFGNAWEDAQGVIRADFVRTDDLFLQNDWMPALMRGEDPPAPRANPALLVVDPQSGRARIEVRPEVTEFPCVDPRVVGRRYRYVYCPARVREAGPPGLNGLARINVETGAIESHAYAAGMNAEEHVVVPRPGTTGEGDAWVVGAGFDTRRQQGFVTVFDGLDVAAGPVATAWLPYWTPPCFHGKFHAA